MKTFFEPIPEHSTPRKCSSCLRHPEAGVQPSPATHWRYRADRDGAKDKSSRQPVCERHAGEK